MKLSEAIRLGSTVVENSRWLYLHANSNGKVKGCAIGAALYAYGVRNHGFWIDREKQIQEIWPWTIREIDCPYCHDKHGKFGQWMGLGNTVAHRVSHLHCADGFSRNAIADWIATIEPKDEPAQKAIQSQEHYVTTT